MVISVKETHANPYYLLYEEEKDFFLKKSKDTVEINRRQDVPVVYEINGAVYVINTESLKKYKSLGAFPKKKKYVMDKLHSIDLDDMLDWEFCEFLMARFKI